MPVLELEDFIVDDNYVDDVLREIETHESNLFSQVMVVWQHGA